MQRAAPTIGRVLAVNGSQATIGLMPQAGASDEARATVGKFLSIPQRQIAADRHDHRRLGRGPGGRARQGLRRDRQARPDGRDHARRDRGSRFQRGVANYPAIGDGVAMMSNAELRVIYEMAGSGSINIGHLQQDPSIGGYINGTEMVGKHFAVLGTTGVGKSSGVAIILHELQKSRPDLRIFLVDPHNEYGRFFGDRRAGAHAAQRQAAVLAVQFRRDRRRRLQRSAGHRRGSRNPLRGHPAREGHVHPVPRRGQPARRQVGRSPATPASPSTRRCRTGWPTSSA